MWHDDAAADHADQNWGQREWYQSDPMCRYLICTCMYLKANWIYKWQMDTPYVDGTNHQEQGNMLVLILFFGVWNGNKQFPRKWSWEWKTYSIYVLKLLGPVVKINDSWKSYTANHSQDASVLPQKPHRCDSFGKLQHWTHEEFAHQVLPPPPKKNKACHLKRNHFNRKIVFSIFQGIC